MYIRIQGTVYNVAKFTHPGEERMLRLGVGMEDATFLFESMHPPSDRVKTILKSLPVIDTYTPRSGSPWQSQMYTALAGVTSPTPSELHELSNLWIALHFLFHACGLGFLYLGYWMAIPVLSFAFVFSGFTVYHALHHGSLKASRWMLDLLELHTNLHVYHGDDWRLSHNIYHHLYTNDPSLDDDKAAALPFIRLHPNQPKQWYHRYQHYYIWPLFLLYGLQMAWGGKFASPWKLVYPVSELILLFLGPAYYHGLWAKALFYYLAIRSLAGFMTAWLFIVSHNSEDITPTKVTSSSRPPPCERLGGVSKDVRLGFSTENPCWAKNQIQESVNWGGKCAAFFFGGINYQIEHHLFPRLHPYYYLSLAPQVKAYCQQNNIRYVHYSTFGQALGATCRYIASMGS